MTSADATTDTTRRRQARSNATRRALLDAAVQEFATHGFEGASTRTIAARARTHQPQINYHFESKEALWRAAVDHLFAKLNEELADALLPGPDEPSIATRDGFGRMIRAFVRGVARLPELNRVMVQEATTNSDRLPWIVERHVRPSFNAVTAAWAELRQTGTVPQFDEAVLYYSVVGAASLAYVNAAEARLLGVDPADEAFIDAHAAALVTMILGPDEHQPGP